MKQAVQEAIQNGHLVSVLFDCEQPGVQVPIPCKCLAFGPGAEQRELSVNDLAIQCLLRFSGEWRFVRVPWKAIKAMAVDSHQATGFGWLPSSPRL